MIAGSFLASDSAAAACGASSSVYLKANQLDIPCIEIGDSSISGAPEVSTASAGWEISRPAKVGR
jgi:hypothetical protein